MSNVWPVLLSNDFVRSAQNDEDFKVRQLVTSGLNALRTATTLTAIRICTGKNSQGNNNKCKSTTYKQKNKI
jgi:hypothetical protein